MKTGNTLRVFFCWIWLGEEKRREREMQENERVKNCIVERIETKLQYVCLFLSHRVFSNTLIKNRAMKKRKKNEASNCTFELKLWRDVVEAKRRRICIIFVLTDRKASRLSPHSSWSEVARSLDVKKIRRRASRRSEPRIIPGRRNQSADSSTYTVNRVPPND